MTSVLEMDVLTLCTIDDDDETMRDDFDELDTLVDTDSEDLCDFWTSNEANLVEFADCSRLC